VLPLTSVLDQIVSIDLVEKWVEEDNKKLAKWQEDFEWRRALFPPKY
jgi:hypothetical protein